MIFKKLLTFILSLFLVCTTLAQEEANQAIQTPIAPDYSSLRSWFKGDSLQGREGEFDVFFIYPTVVFDWTTPTGELCCYMDTDNGAQRSSADNSLWLGYRLFADKAGANYFAPYYRQITIQSWALGVDQINSRFFGYAFEDIKRAFDYYIKTLNQGRPFVLAGHSQGAKGVIELLKNSFTPEIASRLVAAYPIGFELTEQDMCSPYIKPAKDSIDIGVTVLYNSVATVEAEAPILDHTRCCINPLNWCTDTTKADRSTNPGSVWISSQGELKNEVRGLVGTQIDTINHVLIVDGINAKEYFFPKLSMLFPEGNYHLYELQFYFRALEKNIGRRYCAFNKK
ncbi:MAG: DUF3089 domain-containing protein [Mucinivorans sp.]